MKTNFSLLTLAIPLFLLQASCTKQLFSLAPEQNIFRQNSASHSKQVDILWVIDNSQSMETSQTNLANNFNSFIDGFMRRGMQFQMAFTTSDAYRSIFTRDQNLSKFRDGSDQYGHSGVFIINNETPNMKDVFIKNVMQGTMGAGDERVFQSFRETLLNPANANFLRADSMLSVIIVSDEDDFSHDGSTTIGGQYNNPALHPVSRYIDFLDSFTFSQPQKRNYSVSTISILDQACYDQLHAGSSGQKIGRRYVEMVDQTNGIKASLCSNFSEALNKISGRLIELATQFHLSRVPKVETIKISIDGVDIPEDPINGWTYDPANNSIIFHGTSVPEENAVIAVDFEPSGAR